jgi:hypothetical protein
VDVIEQKLFESHDEEMLESWGLSPKQRFIMGFDKVLKN